MKVKESFSRKVFCVCNVLFLLAIIVVVMFPYLNVIAKAFNDGQDTSMGGITIYPRVPTLLNFETVLADPSIIRAFFVSVAVVVSGTLLALTVQFMTAYVFINKKLVGRGAIMLLFLIPMYFGGGLIPQYILYANVGLLDNFLVYILPGAFSAYNMIIMRSYLSSVHISLFEAARIDGASDFRMAFGIALPLAKPVLATVGLWLAVGFWNNWTTTMYYIMDKDLFTLQYVLVQILKEAERIQAIIMEAMLSGQFVDIDIKVTSESIKCAQLVVTTLPIVMVYPFLQKYFIKGTTLGAVKD